MRRNCLTSFARLLFGCATIACSGVERGGVDESEVAPGQATDAGDVAPEVNSATGGAHHLGSASGGVGSGGVSGSGVGTGGSGAGGTEVLLGTGGGSANDAWGCAGHDYVFCEDFEGESIDSAKWDYQGGSAELSTEHVAGGSQSLKLVFSSGSSSPVLQVKNVPEALRSHLFGRVVVWSQEPYPGVQYPGDNYVTQQHVEFFRARSSQANDYMGFAAGVVGQMRLTSPNDSDVGLGEFVPQTSMCLEWEFDPGRTYAQGFVTTEGATTNGESPPEGSADWQLPGGSSELSILQLGLVVITSTTPDMHVWLDEFVLDTQRVGCPSLP